MMTLTVNSKVYSFKPKGQCEENIDDQAIRSTFENLVVNDLSAPGNQIECSDNKFTVKKLSNIPIHTFILEMEKIGKSVEIEKQTVIHVR